MLKPPAIENIPEGFEFVSRHGNYGGWFRTLLYFLTYIPPGMPDTITIKVREKSTGAIHSVTASDERVALAKLRDRILIDCLARPAALQDILQAPELDCAPRRAPNRAV